MFRVLARPDRPSSSSVQRQLSDRRSDHNNLSVHSPAHNLADASGASQSHIYHHNDPHHHDHGAANADNELELRADR